MIEENYLLKDIDIQKNILQKEDKENIHQIEEIQIINHIKQVDVEETINNLLKF